MTKLWQKTKKYKLHPFIEKYTVGEDYKLDLRLLPYDIQATKVHVDGINSIGILSKLETAKVKKVLDDLNILAKQGKIGINIEDEDCHTVIENFLTEKLGNVGKRVHTGRSRNDQVLTALRLYEIDKLNLIKVNLLNLAEKFLKYADSYKNIPIPGYSHMQQAMLSSIGHYYASYLESLIDDFQFIDKVVQQINKSPLGSAAGFGVSLDLPRYQNAKNLKFDGLLLNSLYSQTTRGKYESIILEALAQIMLTLCRFASDVLLFTTFEFHIFEADDYITTGSSIMPQKKNLDCLELLRANAKILLNKHKEIQDIYIGLISGYNRDFQLMKEPLFDAIDITEAGINLVSIVLDHIKPNNEITIDKNIFTADLALDLVKKENYSFRDAYNVVLEKMAGYKEDLQENLKSKKSIGAPGNLRLVDYKKIINKFKSKIKNAK